MSLPLGQRENEILEFKGRAALSDPKKIGREVVAFLNTEGGDIFIGLREERGVAIEVETIEEAEQRAQDLRKSLGDSIEPSPAPGEVEAAAIMDSGRAVIRVRVRRGKYGPYALLGREGARRYLVRIDSSSVPMDRVDLAHRFAGTSREEDPISSVRERLRGERDERQKWGEDELWVAIQPVREVSLNTGDQRFETLLSDREALGVDPEAPSFHVPFKPEVRQDRLVLGIQIPGQDKAWSAKLKETTLHKDGGIRFRAVLRLLYRHATGTTSRVVNPDVLIGVLLSLLKLASGALAEVLDDEDRLVIDLALFGVGREEALIFPGRWRLPRPGREAHVYEDGDDLTLTKPPDFTFRDVRESPERCVFRLLALVYEAFGWREDAIPMALDARTGRAKVPA